MFKNKLFSKRIICSIATFLITTTALFAQFGNTESGIETPVSFEVSSEHVGDSTFNVLIKATIDPGWHLPSQREIPEGEDGPLPTEFVFENEENAFELIGETSEPKGIEKYDEIFKSDLKYFENEAVFEQQIKVTGKSKSLPLSINFMICDDEKCLPPDSELITLNFNLGQKTVTSSDQQIEVSETDEKLTESLKINLEGDLSQLEEDEEEKSFSTIFLLGFVGGLIALLTPCVFPMIPLTVSFFTKGARTRKIGLINAVLYAGFIFAIYLLLSLPFHLLDSVNPEILNNISTNTTLNIVFFVIFIVFAISFFGYFEITLPNSWSNRLDQKATSVGGILGVFFMALTLALVSFSCTGPILGSLLGGSLTSDGGATQLTYGMGGFGLALALPFGLFALFPNWLNSLPKSGGWMNTLKVVLGFLELGLAFKFLSNADLVEHWGLLKREIFIGIWIVIGIAMALYLFGIIKFPHDPPKVKLKTPRVIIALITVVFVAYLVPGLTNTESANLKLLSGFPPPLFYSVYEKESTGPLGLKAYKDFDEGIKAAKEQNKPILLDFTGWACVNCRKMEEQVWSVPEVYELINEEYILISLYVDDRKMLPESEQFNFERPNGSIKKIRTIGDKWATFQTVNFKNNSQPYYVLLNSEKQILAETVGYMPNSSEYYEWLKKGIRQQEN
ncbi:MAG: cytochrome c biogenesis protein CcdA [Bacteroidota bacterium]